MAYRILLVDDEKSILVALKEYFAAHDYEVDCACGRVEAEALLSGHLYHVVISDLRLDRNDDIGGLRLLHHVVEVQPSARTMLLTGYGSPQVENEARCLGVDALLCKPTPLSEVVQMVRVLTGAQ